MFKIGDKVRKKRGFFWHCSHNPKEIAYGVVTESGDSDSYYTDVRVFTKNDELVKPHYTATTISLEKFETRHHPLTNIFQDDKI